MEVVDGGALLRGLRILLRAAQLLGLGVGVERTLLRTAVGEAPRDADRTDGVEAVGVLCAEVESEEQRCACAATRL